jgi:hypothetical protein
VKPRFAFLVLLLSLNVYADQDLTACSDEYSDCHDNCSLRFGTSTQAKDRIKLGKCLEACQKTENSCRDRYIETHVHQLDEGAARNADKHDDDVREDARHKPTVDDDDKPKTSSKRSTSSNDDAKPKNEPREEDYPKRTATRAADLDPKPARSESKPEQKAEPKAEARAEPKPEPKPEPVAEKPAPEKKADEPPPSKKKQRALDEWDPEAL